MKIYSRIPKAVLCFYSLKILLKESNSKKKKKRKSNSAICNNEWTWRVLCLFREIIHTEKDKYYTFSHIYRIEKNLKINGYNKTKIDSYIQRTNWLPGGREVGERARWGRELRSTNY